MSAPHAGEEDAVHDPRVEVRGELVEDAGENDAEEREGKAGAKNGGFGAHGISRIGWG